MDITVTVEDTLAPTLHPVPDQGILWPPNHDMIEIVIEANASDNTGDPPTLTAIVASDELEEGQCDGDMAPDWTEPVITQSTGIINLQLRAERSMVGDGRVYTVTVTATDESNNSSTTDVGIIVPYNTWSGGR